MTYFSDPIITIYEKDNTGTRRNDAAIASIPEIVATSFTVFLIFLAIIYFPVFCDYSHIIHVRRDSRQLNLFFYYKFSLVYFQTKLV